MKVPLTGFKRYQELLGEDAFEAGSRRNSAKYGNLVETRRPVGAGLKQLASVWTGGPSRGRGLLGWRHTGLALGRSMHGYPWQPAQERCWNRETGSGQMM